MQAVLRAAKRQQMIRAIRTAKRGRRKAKPIALPTAQQIQYSALLRRHLRKAQQEALVELLPLMQLFNERADLLQRQDAVKINLAPKPPKLPTLFESTITRLKRIAKLRVPGQAIKSVFQGLHDWNRQAMNEAVKPVTLLPIWEGTTPGQQELLAAAVTDNVSLIGSIETELHARVESTLYDAWTQGKRSHEVAGMLADQFGITERRANLIARTEITKANAQLIETRSTDLGIETYTWKTANDDRVRKRHKELNGSKQKFAEPPRVSEDGQAAIYANPGESYNCRCGAIPNVNEYLDTLLGEEADA